MPRRLRRALGGEAYHVLNRAAARFRIFRTDADYLAMERVLAEALKRVPTRLLAYCQMPNHWHLVLWPREDGELSAFLNWLTLTHTQRWRHAHHTVGYGPVYQGRFKSFPGRMKRCRANETVSGSFVGMTTPYIVHTQRCMKSVKSAQSADQHASGFLRLVRLPDRPPPNPGNPEDLPLTDT
jgi:REP element-mobilizing transposase RayT